MSTPRALVCILVLSSLGLGCQLKLGSTPEPVTEPVPEQAPAPPPEEAIAPTDLSSPTMRSENMLRTRLENGLGVVLVEDHSAPVVALNVWVRTGSAEETALEAGMAHVFEHMLFKGTERRQVGEIARSVEAAGGNINAFTSFDMTVYHITMASRDVSTGIDVLADAIQHSAFDPNELANETDVILEEIRRGEDSPNRVLSQAIFSLAYTRHPYRRPVIGTTESVTSFTRDQLLDFHRRWYAPNNVTFVAVGDLDPTAALEQIRAAFESADPRLDLAHPREEEPEQSRPRAILLRRDFERTLVGVAYPITAFSDDDTAYLDLLSMVLGAGESSRLYRNVKDRRRLVHTISASSYTPLDPGLFFIEAGLEPEHIEATLRTIGEEILRLQSFGPSEAELERARINLLAGEVHEKETVQGQARKIGYFETLAGGMEYEEKYLERVRRATPDDLKRVATEYLVPERANIGALISEGNRDGMSSDSLVDALSYARRTEQSLKPEELAEGIWRYELRNGLRVIVKRSPRIPLVSLRIAFLGGLLAENADTQGISSFVADMLDRGTEQRSAAQIAAEVEGIAGGLEGFSGRNSVGLTGEFLTESLDTGLDLFADVLLHPSFPEEEIEKLRSDRLAAIRRREDNLAAKAFDLFSEALYADHPYRFPALGTEKSVKAIDRDALVRYYSARTVPGNGVLSVVGDVNPNEVIEALDTYLGRWSGPDATPLPKHAEPISTGVPRDVSLEKGKQQVHIVMGFPGLTIYDDDGPAVEVLTQVLAGQGGRLFLELRDRQSLAYSVTAFSLEGIDPGAFGTYIACAPEKREQALAGLRLELERIRDTPIEQQELDRAKAYLIGSQAVSLQSYNLQASLLSLDELYKLGATHHLSYAKKIEAVTRESVQQAARRLIDLDAPVIAEVR